MKKVYLIHVRVPRYLYDKGIKYFLSKVQDFRSQGDYMVGIYAWTDSKNIMEEFLTIRSKKIYNTIEIVFDDKEEFKNFKSDNKDSMLDYRIFNASSCPHEKKDLTIVSTFNEFIQSTEYGSENMNEFGLSDIDMVDYNIFKSSIIDALDVLNYTASYDVNSESDDTREYIDYQLSYGLSTYGNKIRFDTHNEVNVLLHLYKFFFDGLE